MTPRPHPATKPTTLRPLAPEPPGPALALAIRQPHAEAVMRGAKVIEYRSSRTSIRGRILIYASLGRYDAATEAEMMLEYGIDGLARDSLPRGLIVGSVELFDCLPTGDGYE
jgi:hypothetical protein